MGVTVLPSVQATDPRWTHPSRWRVHCHVALSFRANTGGKGRNYSSLRQASDFGRLANLLSREIQFVAINVKHWKAKAWRNHMGLHERNKVQPFTIISGESIILIKFSPFGGVTLYGEEGRAMQALVAWLRQEHPNYKDYSSSTLNYPIKQQFVRQSLPFKN